MHMHIVLLSTQDSKLFVRVGDYGMQAVEVKMHRRCGMTAVTVDVVVSRGCR